MIYYKFIDDKVSKRDVQHKTGFELLQKAMREEYGLDIIESDITSDKNGKPCFLSYRDTFFNISHCDGLCCVIVSPDEPCGIDCELIREHRPNVINRVFNDDEAEWFGSLPCCDRDRYFYILWTLKEAYGKFTGKGIADMKNVSFALNNGVLTSNKPQLDFFVYNRDNYILSVCTKKGTPIRCTFGKQIL